MRRAGARVGGLETRREQSAMGREERKNDGERGEERVGFVGQEEGGAR